jgi:hypothetical protein
VAASVVFAAATQLRHNYASNCFNIQERQEVELILHLVGHYGYLGASSKCHVRERMHFYLKKLQCYLTAEKKVENKSTKKAEVTAEGDSISENMSPFGDDD